MRGILRPLQSAPSTIPIRWEMPDSGVFQQDLRVLHLVTRLLPPGAGVRASSSSRQSLLCISPSDNLSHLPVGSGEVK